ncbi:MAG: hypothetical protein KKB13_04925 [Chloroflexi bacterium]|nr:hypothetical protein [Chloroflexota bacterium]
MSNLLVTPDFLYCKGCGHHLVARNTVRALEALELAPQDVVLVTDIGCHGIADRNFATHTVHGLHGRSVALATGIALGLESGKKVVVFVGDGGATIGLQHILEAARHNFDLTVVVHNNMLYGMTGGQPSGLTPCGFCTTITPCGCALGHHDLCRLARDAGAAHVSRVVGLGDYAEPIRDALTVDGFALVEVLELCPSYGAKLNPGLRLRELVERTGYELGTWSHGRPAFRLQPRPTTSLLDLTSVPGQWDSPLPANGKLALVISGSAGEGAQSAAELFALAGMAAGLTVTRKGSYPVTVGVGFSTAEIMLSRGPIDYHDVAEPDMVLITSEDGLGHNRERIRRMPRGTVWLDASLPVPETGAQVQVRDFRGRAGPRNAALYALLVLARETGVVPVEALVKTLRESAIGHKLPAELLEDAGW